MDDSDVERFATTYQLFMDRVLSVVREREGEGREPLADRVQSFMGADVSEMPCLTERFRPYEHATVQVALDALLASEGLTAELVGIGGGMEREHHSFSEMLQVSRRHRMFWIGSVDWANVQISADDEMSVVRFGLYLVDDHGTRLAVLLRGGSEEHGPGGLLEVLAPSAEAARAFLARLRDERVARNLLRGQVVSFDPSPFDPGVGPVRFHRRPQMRREQVVLADGVLDRVERQIAGIARHRERLRTDGRHLKRGVLLYGPPGTGKTHTVRWLTASLTDFTVVLLTGPGIAFIEAAASLARQLQPSLVVLEDVDLVAEERSHRHGGGPLLFSVLDELDGLDADADVAFLLTTNRVDVLEPALAQRPGRVDLAVEVPLPDEPQLLRLLELYGTGIVLTPGQAEEFARRVVGVPASFVKEAARRATLVAAERGDAVTTGNDLLAVADELLADQETLTRRTLGGPPGWTPPEPARVMPDRFGWFAYGVEPD